MSDAKSNSLRAIAHQLDAWLTQHGDTTRALRALMLLREEIAGMAPVTPASETTAKAEPASGPATDAGKPADAGQSGGGDALDILATLLGGFLPHSTTPVEDKATKADARFGGVPPSPVSSAIVEVAEFVQTEGAAKLRDILAWAAEAQAGAKKTK